MYPKTLFLFVRPLFYSTPCRIFVRSLFNPSWDAFNNTCVSPYKTVSPEPKKSRRSKPSSGSQHQGRHRISQRPRHEWVNVPITKGVINVKALREGESINQRSTSNEFVGNPSTDLQFGSSQRSGPMIYSYINILEYHNNVLYAYCIMS